MNRFRRLELLLFLTVLTAVSPQVSHAADTEDALIKGVSDFLLDRANDNYVYIFQRKLESNKGMQTYLPATMRVVKAGDLRSLLTNKELWRDALEQDLELGKGKLLASVVDKLKDFINQKDLCGPEDPPMSEANPLFKPCQDARAALASARARGGRTVAKIPERTSLAVTTFTDSGKIQLAREVLGGLKSDLDQIWLVDCKKGAYTICVIQITALLDAFAHADYALNCRLAGNWCWNNERDKTIQEESDDFKDFRRFALFFAQMADAADTKDPDRVKALLKSVTVPPVSFGIKREPHATRVLITAYLGVAGSRETAGSHTQAGGFVAPVGIEVSQARGYGDSLSLLLSPLDFGYPLTLKMKNVDTTIRGSDVVVPAVYAFWGFKNYPLAIGAGYSRGRGVDNPDQRVGRYLILFAFDMPLFRLH